MAPPSNQLPDSPHYDPQVLLNSQPAMITVIDPKSYKILFQNHASRSKFGEASNLACHAEDCALCHPLLILQDAEHR